MIAATTARLHATPSSVNGAIKQIADVMRRANYAGALQYTHAGVDLIPWIPDERKGTCRPSATKRSRSTTKHIAEEAAELANRLTSADPLIDGRPWRG